MTTPPQPPKGNMVLWDHIFPPLLDGSYRWRTETDVTYQIAQQGQGQPPLNQAQDLPEAQGYFNVEGPRFSLDASQIATVFPPKNGHGGFNESLAPRGNFQAHLAVGTGARPAGSLMEQTNAAGLECQRSMDGAAGF